jgi:hypothetical protein
MPEKRVQIQVLVPVRDRAKALAELIAKEKGMPVPLHLAVGFAIEEAIERRKKAKKP